MDEPSHVSVETLFRDMAEQLGLQWVAGRNGGQRTLSSETIQKPTLALIGHLNFVHPNRVQVLGLRRNGLSAQSVRIRPAGRHRPPVFDRAGRHRRLQRRSRAGGSARQRRTHRDAAVHVDPGESRPDVPPGALPDAAPGRGHLAPWRVSRSARYRRAHQGRRRRRQERTGAGTHHARPPAGRRRRGRSEARRPGNAGRHLPAADPRLSRSARPRHSQHPLPVRRNGGQAAKESQAHRRAGASAGNRRSRSQPARHGGIDRDHPRRRHSQGAHPGCGRPQPRRAGRSGGAQSHSQTPRHQSGRAVHRSASRRPSTGTADADRSGLRIVGLGQKHRHRGAGRRRLLLRRQPAAGHAAALGRLSEARRPHAHRHRHRRAQQRKFCPTTRRLPKRCASRAPTCG